MYVYRDHNIINIPKSPRTMSWKIIENIENIEADPVTATLLVSSPKIALESHNTEKVGFLV